MTDRLSFSTETSAERARTCAWAALKPKQKFLPPSPTIDPDDHLAVVDPLYLALAST
jgi:hypothetical protein